jgi:hypothetical protein
MDMFCKKDGVVDITSTYVTSRGINAWMHAVPKPFRNNILDVSHTFVDGGGFASSSACDGMNPAW